MNKLVKLSTVGALALSPAAAFAQATTPPDLTPISDAVVSGLGQGITVLLALAPIVILFSVVMAVLRKSKSVAN